MVSDIFSDIYHFTHPQAFMFRNALQKRMAECQDEELLTLGSLVKTIEAFPLRSAYDNETKVALLRRIVPLTQGQAGKALDGSKPQSLEALLGKTACLQLGHLRDVQTRAIFGEIVLKSLYEQRSRSSSGLEHLTVVEEARNIAPARRAEDPPSVGERMVSELRKFGEAMMFVAQFPSQVASEVVKNSGTRIVHRVSWPEDVRMIGDSMGLSQAQREHVMKLGVGEAVVSVARIPKPVLVQVKPYAEAVLAHREASLAGEEYLDPQSVG
jgi:DNA helicase HerA-like ATPase